MSKNKHMLLGIGLTVVLTAVIVKFNKKGSYMYHCHILEHEEAGMMGQIKVE